MKKWSDEGLQKGVRAIEGKSHKDLNEVVKFTSRRMSNTSKKISRDNMVGDRAHHMCCFSIVMKLKMFRFWLLVCKNI